MGPHRGVFQPAYGLTETDIAPPVGVFDTLSSLKENWSVDKEFEPQKSKNGYLEWKEAVNKVLTD